METTKPERGGCLTAFLIFMLILNPLTALYYLFSGSTLRQALPTLPAWAIPTLAILAIANFVFALAIWKWKKWGLYGFAATSLIVFVINLISIGFFPALSGLIGLGLLVFLLRNVWGQME
jgi:hypothetical protein